MGENWKHQDPKIHARATGGKARHASGIQQEGVQTDRPRTGGRQKKINVSCMVSMVLK